MISAPTFLSQSNVEFNQTDVEALSPAELVLLENLAELENVLKTELAFQPKFVLTAKKTLFSTLLPHNVVFSLITAEDKLFAENAHQEAFAKNTNVFLNVPQPPLSAQATLVVMLLTDVETPSLAKHVPMDSVTMENVLIAST